jgi:DNA-binding transcriptional LysR family regulator
MDLNEIAIFARVVQAQSFTAAGRALGLPKSTVSRKVSELEQRLGTRLLQRTTRSLSLTDAGRAYYDYASRIVTEVEEADLAVTTMQGAPRGLLRVTAPLAFDLLGAMVSSYLVRYPEVQLQLTCTDRVVDLVEEGFDVAVRAGRLADSSLIARHLGTGHALLVASPQLLGRHGAVKRPQDLERLPALVFGAGADRARWTLVRKDEPVTVNVKPRFVTNDFGVLEGAALAGVGVALLPTMRSEEFIRDGRLRVVLPAWRSLDIPIQAVYPSTRLLSPKVKTFVDHLQERFASVLTPAR